jgi:heme/copper-type cytochrome/quinol oxidase subunit 2
MRVVFLWIMLAISSGVFATTLLATRHHRKHGAVSAHKSAFIEYMWAIVPWFIVALAAAPAISRIFNAAAG